MALLTLVRTILIQAVFLYADCQAAIVESVSSVWWHWLIAKLLAGFGIGAVQATLPVVGRFSKPAELRKTR